jgi:hypothetical protein
MLERVLNPPLLAYETWSLSPWLTPTVLPRVIFPTLQRFTPAYSNITKSIWNNASFAIYNRPSTAPSPYPRANVSIFPPGLRGRVKNKSWDGIINTVATPLPSEMSKNVPSMSTLPLAIKGRVPMMYLKIDGRIQQMSSRTLLLALLDACARSYDHLHAFQFFRLFTGMYGCHYLCHYRNGTF